MLGFGVGGLLVSISLFGPLYSSILLTLAAAVLALYALSQLPEAPIITKPLRLKYSDQNIPPLVVTCALLFQGLAKAGFMAHAFIAVSSAASSKEQHAVTVRAE
jgi:hypothetical protein